MPWGKILLGASKSLVLTTDQQGSLAASHPSKEYIYAGNRLIATEEQQASAPANLASPSGEYVIWRRPLGARLHRPR